MNPLHANWVNLGSIRRHDYVCGHCGTHTGTKDGYYTTAISGQPMPTSSIYMCGGCNRPTYFNGGQQIPPPKLGAAIPSLPTQGVAELYDEVRAATSAGAYTAAVTIARTLLAQVAVNKGAAVGQSFLAYVNWLEANGFTTGPMKPWVDHIRDQANVSAHELTLMGVDEATRSLKFVEMLLRIVYEFPAAVPPPAQPA